MWGHMTGSDVIQNGGHMCASYPTFTLLGIPKDNHRRWANVRKSRGGPIWSESCQMLSNAKIAQGCYRREAPHTRWRRCTDQICNAIPITNHTRSVSHGRLRTLYKMKAKIRLVKLSSDHRQQEWHHGDGSHHSFLVIQFLSHGTINITVYILSM